MHVYLKSLRSEKRSTKKAKREPQICQICALISGEKSRSNGSKIFCSEKAKKFLKMPENRFETQTYWIKLIQNYCWFLKAKKCKSKAKNITLQFFPCSGGWSKCRPFSTNSTFLYSPAPSGNAPSERLCISTSSLPGT